MADTRRIAGQSFGRSLPRLEFLELVTPTLGSLRIAKILNAILCHSDPDQGGWCAISMPALEATTGLDPADIGHALNAVASLVEIVPSPAFLRKLGNDGTGRKTRFRPRYELLDEGLERSPQLCLLSMERRSAELPRRELPEDANIVRLDRRRTTKGSLRAQTAAIERDGLAQSLGARIETIALRLDGMHPAARRLRDLYRRTHPSSAQTTASELDPAVRLLRGRTTRFSLPGGPAWSLDQCVAALEEDLANGQASAGSDGPIDHG